MSILKVLTMKTIIKTYKIQGQEGERDIKSHMYKSTKIMKFSSMISYKSRNIKYQIKYKIKAQNINLSFIFN
jgi:hypothetical protein